MKQVLFFEAKIFSQYIRHGNDNFTIDLVHCTKIIFFVRVRL